MRRVLPVMLLVFVVVGIGGYCITWFAQAAQAKRNVEQLLTLVNAKQPYLTYESLETSGFPFDIYLTITKPHFTGRIDTLLQELAAGSTDAELKQSFAKLPEIHQDILADGSITLGISPLSDRYVLQMHGNWLTTSTLAGQKTTMVSESPADNVCHLQMARGSLFTLLWDVDFSRREPQQLARDFRMFDCIIPEVTITDASSKAVLASRGASRFYITSTPDGGQENIRLYLKSADTEITPAGDAMVESYASIIRAFDPYAYIPKYSSFGKQSVELDMTFAGSFPAQGGVPFSGNMEFRIDKFDMSSNMHKSNASFLISNRVDNGQRFAKLALNSVSTVTELYDNYLEGMIASLVRSAYDEAGKAQVSPYKSVMERYTQDEMVAIVQPAIPKFQPLGKMVQSADASYQGDEHFTNGEFNLAGIEVSATPYGITGKGTAKTMPGQMFPTANIVLVCANCAVMMDDIASYAARIQNVMAYFAPEGQGAPNVKIAEAVKRFMTALAAKDADGTTFTYAISSSPAMGVEISGKNMQAIQSLYNEYILPAMRE